MAGSIFITGFRGSGKTTYGRALANFLQIPFVDLDTEIETRSGRTIGEIFGADGEGKFRDEECKTLGLMVNSGERKVIALGAGFPLERLLSLPGSDEKVVWLRRETDGQPRSLDGRPRIYSHLSEQEECCRLWKERSPRYRSAASHVWNVSEDEPPAGAVKRFVLSAPSLATAFRITAPDSISWEGTVPSSKSEVVRALMLAAQADHPVRITAQNECDDIKVLCTALSKLGVSIKYDETGFLVSAPGDGLAASGNDMAEINAGSSAAVLRFLIPLLAKSRGDFLLRGSERLHQRPVGPLVDAVRKLGGEIEYAGRDGFAPLKITGGSFGNVAYNPIEIDSGTSSQFASALLLSSVGMRHPPELLFTGEMRSRPYLEMTKNFLKLRGGEMKCEADASSAAYLLALGILGGEVIIHNYPARTHQADTAFVEIMHSAGCRIERVGTTVRALRSRIKPLGVNCGDCPDLAPLLSVLATFTEGKSRIYGAPHLRWKESNRIEDMKTELEKMGRKESPLDPHKDHRLAMSLSLLAFHGQSITIADPGVVTKSFPEFWLTLVAAGCGITCHGG